MSINPLFTGGGTLCSPKLVFSSIRPRWHFVTINAHVNSYFGPRNNLRPSYSQLDHFGHRYGQFFIANSGISKVSEIPFFKYCWQKNHQNTIILLIWYFSVLGIGLSFDLSHQTWWLKHFWQFYGVLKCRNWKKLKIWLRPSGEDCQKFKMSAIRPIFDLESSNFGC